MKPYNYFPIDRQKLADAMAAFAHEKPGFDKANYYSESSYKSDYNVYKKSADENRRNLRNPRDYVYYNLSKMDDYQIHDAFRSAYSGRLSINENMSLDYCAGQYWCTEYQQALEAVVDRIGTIEYYGPQDERFYNMYVPEKGDSFYSEHDLVQFFVQSMDEIDKVEMIKKVEGEKVSERRADDWRYHEVKIEDSEEFQNGGYHSRLNKNIDGHIGYAIEGLRAKGWCLNGYQEVPRMYELVHGNGNKEILDERNFNHRAQELTGLSSSKIDITIKAMTAVKDQGFEVKKLEYFPKFKCYAKLEGQSVKTIAQDGKRWTDATGKVVSSPQFKEALMIRFGDKADFLNDPNVIMKAIASKGDLKDAVEAVKKSTSPSLKCQ